MEADELKSDSENEAVAQESPQIRRFLREHFPDVRTIEMGVAMKVNEIRLALVIPDDVFKAAISDVKSKASRACARTMKSEIIKQLGAIPSPPQIFVNEKKSHKWNPYPFRSGQTKKN